MYQKKDSKFSWEKLFKVLFLIATVGISLLYVTATVVISNFSNDFDIFFNGFDVDSTLVEEKYVDYALLEQRALQFEHLLGDYHIPSDMTGEGWDYYPPVSICWSYSNPDVKFYNNSQLLATFDPLDPSSPYNDKDNLTFCGDRGHTALYEGVYTAGEAFRWAWAKRHNDVKTMNAARDRLWKLVKAYELISNVSAKSALLRYAVPNTTLAYEKFPGHWDTTDHDVIEYRGFKWSLSRHLSRDVSIGIMFALSMVHYLVDDVELKRITGDVIDKTVQYWYDCNWRISDSDGAQHTSADFQGTRPFMFDGAHILTFLQMAKMVNPEKWGAIYYHYAYDRGCAASIGRTMRMGADLAPKIFDAYYGCNFLYNNAPTLILLETDPVLREIYVRDWLNVLHDFTKLHRNANFDVVWLLCHTDIQTDIYATPQITLNDYDLEIWKDANILKPTDLDYIQNFCVRDIKDCLMRYAIRRFPNRNYYWATTPGTFPNEHQQPIPNFKYPNYDYWEPSGFSTEFITSMLLGAGRTVQDDGLLNASLPVDLRKDEDIMWQRSPFSVSTTERLTTRPGTSQVPAGPEYLSVYWMAKYLELF